MINNEPAFSLENILIKLNDKQRRIYMNTLKKYEEVSNYIASVSFKKELKQDDIGDLILRKKRIEQARLCNDLYEMSLTLDDKKYLYDIGRTDLLPPDGLGHDELDGKILPTKIEIELGMYPEQALYKFTPYTCGVFIFYTSDGKFRYVGGSQYIEFYLNQHFKKFDKGITHKIAPVSVMQMLLHEKENMRFQILERVPYSLLDYAIYKNRVKYKCTYSYKKDSWSYEKYKKGAYNY